MKKILLLTTCLLGGLMAADTRTLDGICLPSMPRGMPLADTSALLGGNLKETKGDRVAAPKPSDRGDRKKRTVPAECTTEKAEALAEWFCEKVVPSDVGRAARIDDGYEIPHKEITQASHDYPDGYFVVSLKETDSEICEISSKREGRPAITFKNSEKNHRYGPSLDKMRQLFYKLRVRYLKEDMVSLTTDAVSQRATTFPGLAFFNRVLAITIPIEQDKLNNARTSLPHPHNAEFVKPAMRSDISPHNLFRAFSLYKAMCEYESENPLYGLSCLSIIIKDLQPFYNAEASDRLIIAKHGAFLDSFLGNLYFSDGTAKIESAFVAQLIGLYKSAVIRLLGDRGIDMLDSVRRVAAAELMLTTVEVNNGSMDAFLTRFKNYLSKRNELIEQLKIMQ